MTWLKTILLSAVIAWGSTMGARMPRCIQRWWAHRTGEIAAWLRIPGTSARRPLQAAIYHKLHRSSLPQGSLMSALRLRFLSYQASRKIPVPVLLGMMPQEKSSPDCIQASCRSFIQQYHPDRTVGCRSQQWATQLVAYVNAYRSELFRSKL